MSTWITPGFCAVAAQLVYKEKALLCPVTWADKWDEHCLNRLEVVVNCKAVCAFGDSKACDLYVYSPGLSVMISSQTKF